MNLMWIAELSGQGHAWRFCAPKQNGHMTSSIPAAVCDWSRMLNRRRSRTVPRAL